VSLVTAIDNESFRSLPTEERTIALQGDLAVAQKAEGKDQAHSYWEVAEGFEEIFLYTMLATMRKTTMDSGLLGEGNDAKIYQSMFDQEVALQMSKRHDFGLSRQIFDWLTRNKPELRNAMGKAAQAYRANQSDEVSSVLQNYRFEPKNVNE